MKGTVATSELVVIENTVRSTNSFSLNTQILRHAKFVCTKTIDACILLNLNVGTLKNAYSIRYLKGEMS